MGPSRKEVMQKLSHPFASPIAFWPHPPCALVHSQSRDAPWRAMGWRPGDTRLTTHTPNTSKFEALAHAKLWARYSVHAAATAALRGPAPVALAYVAYTQACQDGRGTFVRLAAPGAEFAAGCVVSVVGIIVNALQGVMGLVLAGICVGLSGFYFAQASLDVFKPPHFEAEL